MWPELRARTGRPRFTRLAPVYFSLKDQSKAGPSEQLSTRCSRDPSSLQTGVHPLGLDPLPLNKGRGLKGAGRVAGGSLWPRPERPTSFLPPFLQAELRHRRPHRHVRCRAPPQPPWAGGRPEPWRSLESLLCLLHHYRATEKLQNTVSEGLLLQPLTHLK